MPEVVIKGRWSPPTAPASADSPIRRCCTRPPRSPRSAASRCRTWHPHHHRRRANSTPASATPITRSATPSSSRSAASRWITTRATARTAWRSRRRPDPARKQGTHRSAQGPGRPAGRRCGAGRHRQLRGQAPDQYAAAFGDGGSARTRHLYGTVDLGGRSDDKRFGYRINAAGERLRSYVKGADGEREFVSGAFDWHISQTRCSSWTWTTSTSRRSPRRATS